MKLLNLGILRDSELQNSRAKQLKLDLENSAGGWVK